MPNYLPTAIQRRMKDRYGGIAKRANAYSLRKIVSTYSGNAIRVRRSSDNLELDIGFVGKNLNTVALLAHVGGGNGFVVTLYDQSGNARNLTQATAAAQPQIVASGAVILRNSKPAILFDGVDDVLSCTIPALTAHTINLVVTPLNSGADLGILNYATNTINQSITTDAGTAVKSYFGSSSNFVSGTSVVGNQSILTRWWNAAANVNFSDIYRNGIGESVRSGTPSSVSAVTTLSLGRAVAFSQLHFQELNVYSVPLTILQRRNLEKEQGSFYKITVFPK
jgi:hypothetical protein